MEILRVLLERKILRNIAGVTSAFSCERRNELLGSGNGGEFLQCLSQRFLTFLVSWTPIRNS